MSSAIRFSRSNLFKIAAGQETAFRAWAQQLGLGVQNFIQNEEEVFGIWSQNEDDGSWPYPPNYSDNEEAYDDDDPQTIVAQGLAQFLRDGSLAVLADVGAEFSGGDTIGIGACAIAVNNHGEIVEWHLADIIEMTQSLGSECLGFEWRAVTSDHSR